MKPWTENEHTEFMGLLKDGVSIDTLCKAIPTRSEAAIVTRARNKKLGLDFRTSGKERKLYKGVSRRQHKKDVNANTIVGEPRAAGTVQEPTTSEITNHESEDIVPYINEIAANKLAIQMLQEKDLCVEPDIIATISKHILKGLK